MIKLLTLITLLMSSIFIMMNHPLSFGIILLMQTTLVAMMTGTASMNFWFSYILFLIMVGGMLILFIYMTSVASNEKFKFSNKMLWMIMIFGTLILISMLIDPYLMSMKIKNYETLMIIKPINLSMSKYISTPNNSLMYLTIIYLLISLIMVVKITNIKYGPLRQKF